MPPVLCFKQVRFDRKEIKYLKENIIWEEIDCDLAYMRLRLSDLVAIAGCGAKNVRLFHASFLSVGDSGPCKQPSIRVDDDDPGS